MRKIGWAPCLQKKAAKTVQIHAARSKQNEYTRFKRSNNSIIFAFIQIKNSIAIISSTESVSVSTVCFIFFHVIRTLNMPRSYISIDATMIKWLVDVNSNNLNQIMIDFMNNILFSHLLKLSDEISHWTLTKKRFTIRVHRTNWNKNELLTVRRTLCDWRYCELHQQVSAVYCIGVTH